MRGSRTTEHLEILTCLNDLYIEVSKQSFDRAESTALKEVMDKAENILIEYNFGAKVNVYSRSN